VVTRPRGVIEEKREGRHNHSGNQVWHQPFVQPGPSLKSLNPEQHPEERGELAKKEMNQFFSSIKTAPAFDGTDQFANYGKFTGMHKALKIALIALAVLIIIGIIWFIKY